MKPGVLNIVIVEDEDISFINRRRDLKAFSPYVDRVYRCSLHNEVYNLDGWQECGLIIANNPENNGLVFFKRFFLKDIVKAQKINGILISRGQEDEVKFVKETRFLYEKSDSLFLGFIYERPGSLERILEAIRNIALKLPPYPIVDSHQLERIKAFIDPVKISQYKEIHRLKYNIIRLMRPYITLIRSFIEERNIASLFARINFQNEAIFQQDYCLLLREAIEKLLFLVSENNGCFTSNYALDIIRIHGEIQSFIATDQNQINLFYFAQILSQYPLDGHGAEIKLLSMSNTVSMDKYLMYCEIFIRSLSELTDFIDCEFLSR